MLLLARLVPEWVSLHSTWDLSLCPLGFRYDTFITTTIPLQVFSILPGPSHRDCVQVIIWPTYTPRTNNIFLCMALKKWLNLICLRNIFGKNVQLLKKMFCISSIISLFTAVICDNRFDSICPSPGANSWLCNFQKPLHPHHKKAFSMLYGWCDTGSCSCFSNSAPHIDPPIWLYSPTLQSGLWYKKISKRISSKRSNSIIFVKKFLKLYWYYTHKISGFFPFVLFYFVVVFCFCFVLFCFVYVSENLRTPFMIRVARLCYRYL